MDPELRKSLGDNDFSFKHGLDKGHIAGLKEALEMLPVIENTMIATNEDWRDGFLSALDVMSAGLAARISELESQ